MKINKFFLFFNKHNESRYPELRNLIAKNLTLVDDISKSDYILVAGGDGSLLEAIQSLYLHDKPFVGVNAGSLGYYMNQYNTEDDIKILNNLTFETIELPMLSFEVTSIENQIYEGRAFADLWIKADRNAMIYNLCVNDNVINYCSIPHNPIYGDGILLSTPVGTTGYAHNLGGSIYPFNVPIYQVVPMASSVSKKTIHPFPVSLDTQIIVNFEQSDYRSGKMFFDGFCLNDIKDYENFKPKQLKVQQSSKKVEIGFVSLSEFRAKSFTWLY